VLKATNVAQPLSQWRFIITNYFDGLGNFRFTNAADPNVPQGFYRLQVQ